MAHPNNFMFKDLKHHEPSPIDGSTGMGKGTILHFNNVRRNLRNFLNRQIRGNHEYNEGHQFVLHQPHNHRFIGPPSPHIFDAATPNKVMRPPAPNPTPNGVRRPSVPNLTPNQVRRKPVHFGTPQFNPKHRH